MGDLTEPQIGPEVEPRPDEDLGQYLLRLRIDISEFLGRRVTLQEVTDNIPTYYSPRQHFSKQWLSALEQNTFTNPGGDKLRALAAAYSNILEENLLKKKVQPEWLLRLANLRPELPRIVEGRPGSSLNELVNDRKVMSVAAALFTLKELGREQEFNFLADLVRTYLHRYDPNWQNRRVFRENERFIHFLEFKDEQNLSTD
jgi:transcriptional regulator with XRE-family HTH domain